jgi:hypothetical protein
MNAQTQLSDKAAAAFALYLVTTCASEQFLKHFENTLQTERITLKLDKKRQFHDLQDAIRKVLYKYDQLTDFAMGLGFDDGVTVASQFDALLFDTNMFCATAVKLYNATAGKPERVAEILQYLQDLKVDKAPFPDSLGDYYAERVKVTLK